MSNAANLPRSQVRIVIVGHVDHGKSTLVGRLLHDTGTLPESRIEAVRASCQRRGVAFEWSFLLDALQAERGQGITIDTAHIWFHSAVRDYVIVDAPGHKEFLRNMVTGAASSDGALLVIDAAEGVREQTRRHGYLLHLLGVRQVAVAVNKMDLVGHAEARFNQVADEIRDYLTGIGVTPGAIVPVAARDGENLITRGDAMPWYGGPSVLDALDRFETPAAAADMPLRLPVQGVYRFDERRIIVGRIESGRLKVGDRLVFAPTGKSAKVATIEAWHPANPIVAAASGQSVAITLDEQIFVERGAVASLEDRRPVSTHTVGARVFWLGREPLRPGDQLTLKINTARHAVEVAGISKVIDVNDLSPCDTGRVDSGAVAEVTFRSRALMTADAFGDTPRTGRFVLVKDFDVVGGGIIPEDGLAEVTDKPKSSNLHAVRHAVDAAERTRANGHRGGILWLTGLSGAGKSTIAVALERQLFLKGYQTYVLDGDNLRHGINADLGFSPEDRAENIRRAGEIAALFAASGAIVVTAFISPYRSDRDRIRARHPDIFHEVFVDAGLEECERRDPKGLYKLARAGKIPEFTGISAPYEAPENPELVVSTARQSIDESVARLAEYADAAFVVGRSGILTVA